MSRKGAIPSGQDWEPQVYNFQQKKSQQESRPRTLTERDASRAAQQGQAVAVQRREHQQLNQQRATAGANAKKIDEDSESFKVKKVDPQLRIRIQKARQELNWTQQDLAQKISERATVVNEYESGKAIPEERVIVKMEKALGIHLRGAKVGEPMGKVRPVPKPKE